MSFSNIIQYMYYKQWQQTQFIKQCYISYKRNEFPINFTNFNKYFIYLLFLPPLQIFYWLLIPFPWPWIFRQLCKVSGYPQLLFEKYDTFVNEFNLFSNLFVKNNVTVQVHGNLFLSKNIWNWPGIVPNVISGCPNCALSPA